MLDDTAAQESGEFMIATSTETGAVSKLHRVLGTWDLILLNIVAIVGLRWLSTAAQIGPSSMVMWVLGLFGFFLPTALAVVELSSRVPGEGGMYLWSKAAFGDIHGFITGWAYWTANLVFFPSALLFSAGIFLHVGGDAFLAHADSSSYNLTYCLIVLWGTTGLGVLGLERAKWLQNIGGMATWTAAALILGAGAWTAYRFGSASSFSAAQLMPDFGQLATYSTLAAMALAFAGLELGPIMGGEIRDPRRQIPRATIASCFIITAIYVCGTAALLVALPASMIDVIGGIPQALAAIGARIGLPHFGMLTAALVALGTIGGISAWVTGTSRLPFVVGVDRYLPQALARLHPTHGTPHIALLVQAALTTLVLIAAMSGASIHEAFVILLDMTIITSLMPLLYIFAALPILRHRAAGRNEGVTLVPGGMIVCCLVGLAGFATTFLAIIPPADSSSPGLFLVEVVGGSALLIAVGLVFYWRGRSNSGNAHLERP
jgi:amino acid transporter